MGQLQTNVKKVNMIHPKTPKSPEVLDAVKNLPTSGTLAQDRQNGMLYLDLDNDWIFNVLAVLQPFGYISPPFFVYPPHPLGAHVKIVTKTEAEDYELFGKKENHVSDLIGKTVAFDVVKSYVSHPTKRSYGVEATYKIKIESPELSQIRKELTGLTTGPDNGNFVILVGLRNLDLNEEMNDEEEKEDKFNPDTLETSITDDEESSSSSSTEDDIKGETQKKKSPVPIMKMETPVPASNLNNNLITWTILIISMATLTVLSIYGFKNISN